ncbi:MAG: TolC family protein [Saprospiraceae bacterium]|nr:TolC family protein [Saprospiraceae bacterium]
MKRSYLHFCRFFLFSIFSMAGAVHFAFAQIPADTVFVFTQNDYLSWVKDRHPAARQALLLLQQAENAELAARGGFDPKLYSDIQQKSFDGKTYYTISESGIKIPTWFGLELKGAYLSAGGINLNPEGKLPDAGQAVLGINATLLRGLLIDERRAALQQAKLLAAMNDAQRRQTLNDLLLDAATTYWNWVAAYNEMRILEQALQIAQNRQRGIVESYLQGDKPAVDTLEAFIQIQTRQYELSDARLAYRNSTLQLSNFMWDDSGNPLALSGNWRPPTAAELPAGMPVPPLDELQTQLLQRHPALRLYDAKIAQLDISRRLASEQLKPQLDVSYNLLGDGARFGAYRKDDSSDLQNLLFQNYKWQITFGFPLLLRKERGKLEEVKVKIADAGLGLQQKQLELRNKLESYYNETLNTEQQITLYSSMIDNYQRLLDAENRKFGLGESSIFLINTREQKLIEAQLKLAKLKATLPKLRLGVDWAVGGSLL